ncbi:MAG: hypothetical protein WCG75_03220 [Armatimonadota bacterium]
MAIAITIASTISIFFFLPATFEQREFSGARPVTFKGYPVLRVGYSRLSQMGHADGKNKAGPFYEGRCYVDYVDGTKVHRTYGYSLSITAHYEDFMSKSGAHVGVKVTKMTIDLH